MRRMLRICRLPRLPSVVNFSWTYMPNGRAAIKETAEVLGVSDSTVEREWNLARVWLLRELSKE